MIIFHFRLLNFENTKIFFDLFHNLRLKNICVFLLVGVIFNFFFIKNMYEYDYRSKNNFLIRRSLFFKM